MSELVIILLIIVLIMSISWLVKKDDELREGFL